jgi:outer membrane protein
MNNLIQICRTFLFCVVFCWLLLCTVHVNARDNSIQIAGLIQQNGSFLSSPYTVSDTKILLSLDDLIDIALKNNQGIESVRQKKVQTEGQLTQAKSGYLPQLSIEGRYYYTERNDSAGSSLSEDPEQIPLDTDEVEAGDVIYGNANISQLIYDFGKTIDSIKIGKSNLDAASSQLQREVQDTVFQVKKGYFNVLEKKRLIDVAAEAVKSFQQHLDRAKVYLRAGVRTRIDVINAEVELSKANINLLRAEYGLKLAQVALIEVLGVTPNNGSYGLYDDKVNLDNILETMPPVPATLDKLLANAIGQRMDIIQLRHLTEAAESNYARAKGDYYPSITAEANYNDYETDLSLYKDSWEVGVACTWELFSGFHTKGAVAEAKGRLFENQAQLKKLQLAVVREVTESYLRTDENRESVRMALQTLELAKENFALAEKRYESGAYDVVEFNDAQLSLTRSRNELVVIYYGYLTAFASIEHAIGSYSRVNFR